VIPYAFMSYLYILGFSSLTKLDGCIYYLAFSLGGRGRVQLSGIKGTIVQVRKGRQNNGRYNDIKVFKNNIFGGSKKS
jgi:hypothetical protein